MRRDYYRGRLFISILVLICIIGIGYATLGANLKINGKAQITSSSWLVRFKANSINVTSGSVSIDTNNNEQAARVDDNNNVSYKVRLSQPGDFYEFSVIVENKGSIDAMIDSISSKLGTTDITTGTLPSYLNYSVTYSDGTPIAAKQLLASDTEEKLKIKIEFKKDINANQLPGSATTLNLNFQLTYVQADNTSIRVRSPLEIGEYFTLVPDQSTYTITADGITGYEYDQTITPNELTLWRVINKNVDGSVDAISEYLSSTDITFNGTQAFANFIGGMQTIASQYGKLGYTDRVRMMGFDGQTLTIEDTTYFDGTISHTLTDESTGTPTYGVGEEILDGLGGDTLYLKDYLLVNNVYGNAIAYKEGDSSPSEYWLTSRNVIVYDRNFYFYYAVRRIDTSGDIEYFPFRLYNQQWADISGSYPIRPIITLNRGVTIASGLGTKASPYLLNEQ